MQFHLLLLYALLPLHAMTCKGSELNNGPFRCARLRGGGRYQGSGIGIIQSSEAEKLRQQGVLKGNWAIESQEEPESDVQDAYPSNWPEEWGGLEETDVVTRMGPGPLRLYLQNKYNRDMLPTGEVSQATLDRLKDSLADENGYAKVEIDENSSDDAPYGQGVGDNSPILSQQSVDNDQVIAQRLMRSNTSPHELDGHELPRGVTPDLAKKWLGEAMLNPFHGDNGASSQSYVPDLDGESQPTQEILAAEKAIDDAIAENDAIALDAAIDLLKRLKDGK
uniref:Uncharacterized protein n=1 Tax=Hanusia phi TaxID=3032 RepID=A0A7S0I3E4_9CRYP|mmetsp:Transcript_9122/g.20936  ORF Transcript_9122/g.20936 Transcript_9122/m.20936 type:complete len:279 (+) Transcript_9122:253-1089(+)